jgi:hypothetical protein
MKAANGQGLGFCEDDRCPHWAAVSQKQNDDYTEFSNTTIF